jgi:RNA polymerase sigma-70 factor (ECF subfamily)
MKPVSEASVAADIDRLIVEMRPKLHRYCARMVGSVIDGEDVLQDALVKAMESLLSAGEIGNPRGWLFRIAHNCALDFLRRNNRQAALVAGEEVEMIADPIDAVTNRQIASASLRTFMRLPVAQRSSVVLTDVLGCSLREVCEVMDFSLPAVKAALHRGARGFASSPMSPTIGPVPNCRKRSVIDLAPMSHISTRGISTPFAP